MLFIELPRPWKLFFDGAALKDEAEAGVILVTPEEEVLSYAFTLIENCSNNVAEYQALMMGLEMTIELKITRLKVFGDSKLITTNFLYFIKLRSLSFYHTLIMRRSSWNGLMMLALSMCLEKKIDKQML